MTATIVRADAQDLPEAVNELSPADRLPVALWSEYRAQNERCDQILAISTSDEECKAAFDGKFAVHLT